jgi:hypothetical protein
VTSVDHLAVGTGGLWVRVGGREREFLLLLHISETERDPDCESKLWLRPVPRFSARGPSDAWMLCGKFLPWEIFCDSSSVSILQETGAVERRVRK